MDFKKIWISHSSINDFDNCSRLYYFKNIYRNPQTKNRIQLVNPYLSLGSAVHDAIDKAVNLSPSQRLRISLIKSYKETWKKYSGKIGGFVSKKQELEFKKRGEKMIKKVENSDLFVKKSLKKTKDLPKTTLIKDVGLTGSFDWIEVLKNGNLHIIDFKTGKNQEKKDSWQLPIYQILVQGNYNKNVEKLSYWYLEKNENLISQKSIDSEIFISKIKEKAKRIKKTIENNNFSCSSFYSRCYWCRGYESIVSGKAEYVGFDEKMKKDLYFLTNGNLILRKIEENSLLNDFEKKLLQMRMNGKTIKEVQEQTKLSRKIIENNVSRIKKKIKQNLTKKELRIFIEELNKNGEKFDFK